eukprot:10044808-Heterocapsa_arctica.AAC.1
MDRLDIGPQEDAGAAAVRRLHRGARGHDQDGGGLGRAEAQGRPRGDHQGDHHKGTEWGEAEPGRRSIAEREAAPPGRHLPRKGRPRPVRSAQLPLPRGDQQSGRTTARQPRVPPGAHGHELAENGPPHGGHDAQVSHHHRRVVGR